VKFAAARLILILFVPASQAQGNAPGSGGASPYAETNHVGSVSPTNEITFEQFLNEVASANLDYAAQRFNVSIAEAAVAAAREFQNPTLALNGARDVTHSGHEEMPTTAGVSLTQTIELGGKRKYRILGARQNYAAAAATLGDFLRNLKFDAAAAFADALSLSRSAEQKIESAKYLKQLADAQRERRRLGDISESDMLQTQVEEEQFQNEVLAAEAEAENASLALSRFLGRNRGQTRLIARGKLELPAHQFDLSQLLADALRNRPDLVALRHTHDAAQSKINEEKANRIPNVDVGAGWTHNSSSENSISPSPEWDSVALSLAFPIPLWNRNKAAIASARASAEQAQKQIEAAELKAEVQIRQSFSAYRSAVERTHHYQSGILKDADAVLEAKRFAYQHGQSTLLELLDAQRTDNEVRSSYNDALADEAKSLIELQRSGNLWEIQF
jgi:cobalt-zinc-cadmium efflux system outer membrane protein